MTYSSFESFECTSFICVSLMISHGLFWHCINRKCNQGAFGRMSSEFFFMSADRQIEAERGANDVRQHCRIDHSYKSR